MIFREIDLLALLISGGARPRGAALSLFPALRLRFTNQFRSRHQYRQLSPRGSVGNTPLSRGFRYEISSKLIFFRGAILFLLLRRIRHGRSVPWCHLQCQRYGFQTVFSFRGRVLGKWKLTPLGFRARFREARLLGKWRERVTICRAMGRRSYELCLPNSLSETFRRCNGSRRELCLRFLLFAE